MLLSCDGSCTIFCFFATNFFFCKDHYKTVCFFCLKMVEYKFPFPKHYADFELRCRGGVSILCDSNTLMRASKLVQDALTGSEKDGKTSGLDVDYEPEVVHLVLCLIDPTGAVGKLDSIGVSLLERAVVFCESYQINERILNHCYEAMGVSLDEKSDIDAILRVLRASQTFQNKALEAKCHAILYQLMHSDRMKTWILKHADPLLQVLLKNYPESSIHMKEALLADIKYFVKCGDRDETSWKELLQPNSFFLEQKAKSSKTFTQLLETIRDEWLPPNCGGKDILEISETLKLMSLYWNGVSESIQD
jgi:hypothetical protein